MQNLKYYQCVEVYPTYYKFADQTLGINKIKYGLFPIFSIVQQMHHLGAQCFFQLIKRNTSNRNLAMM